MKTFILGRICGNAYVFVLYGLFYVLAGKIGEPQESSDDETVMYILLFCLEFNFDYS